jgi:beta-glucosidase
VVGSKNHLALSGETAEKSLVLLKNTGILPLRNVKKIALIGPNADNYAILIGNYNGTPIRPITPLAALRAKMGASNVLYSAGCPIVPGVYTNMDVIGFKNFFHSEKGKLSKGLHAEYFDNYQFKGTPNIVKVDSMINFYWLRSPVTKQVEAEFSVRWTGVLKPTASGKYMFGGNVDLKINGQPVPNTGMMLEKGKTYDIIAEFATIPNWSTNMIEQFARLKWVEVSKDYQKEALDAAMKADVVIFCGGISADLEGEEMPLVIEGFSHGDRTNLNLPKVQEDLLKELHKTGKPVVYVNFSGSAIALNWEAENLPAIVQAFYPGETTGAALTRLLFGEFNPSGRLPVTFYKSEKDLPDFLDYRMEGRTYRYFTGKPLYGFGYGLSYTVFTYANLRVPATIPAGNEVNVSVEVTNSGKTDGEEVVEVYLANNASAGPRPILALSGFKRVFLKAGETKKVEVLLKSDRFTSIDNSYNRVIEPGKYVIYAGGQQPGENVPKAQQVSAEIEITGKTLVLKK